MVRFLFKNIGSRLPGRLDCPRQIQGRRYSPETYPPDINAYPESGSDARFLENDRYENHLRKLRHELHTNSLHFVQSIRDYFPEDTKLITPQGGGHALGRTKPKNRHDRTLSQGHATENKHCPRTYVHTARPIQELHAPELRTTVVPVY